MTQISTPIHTPLGRMHGLVRDGIHVFKGIRYATADRFEPPIAVAGWDDELDATAYGPQCPQLFGMLEQALGGSSLPSGEDCLRVNVFTPGCDGAERPVIVWIHGGAFTTGTGSMPWYDGSQLARRGDVVVVTINYRLGALGFSGRTNAGLRDQVMALEWVQAQIASFGGDPGNVILAGESAGGASLVALMAVPAAEGLFHGAFAMSPSIGQLRSGERADEALAEYLATAGVDSLDELRDAPIERILDAQGTVLRRHPGGGLTDFSPCDDGMLVPSPILDAAARHPARLVLGTTRDEMQLFTTFNPTFADFDDDKLSAQLLRQFGDRAADARRRYAAARPQASPLQLASAVQTDEAFRVPARRLAEARLHAGTEAWMYWFTWASTAFHGRLGSCHAVDIPFVFHNLDRKGVAQFTGEGADRTPVADAYSAALVRFAHHGDPGWDRYETTNRTTRLFDVASPVVSDPESEIRELWP